MTDLPAGRELDAVNLTVPGTGPFIVERNGRHAYRVSCPPLAPSLARGLCEVEAVAVCAALNAVNRMVRARSAAALRAVGDA